MNRFSGKVALITGAGSGIGQAIARRLAAEGAAVFAVDVNGDGLEATATLDGTAGQEPAGSGGPAGEIAVHLADLADPEQCDAVVPACLARFGRLDVLGNVAGIYIAAHATATTREQYRRVMAVNLDACFFLAQAAIPHLLERRGNIVNIASNSGLQGVPYSAAYSMSKGGIVQMTRALAVEFLKSPLRVNAIAPAGTNTNIAVGATFPSDMDMDLARRMRGLRGMAEPEEVAALFAFLASDEARSVTGAVYTIDNGLTVS